MSFFQELKRRNVIRVAAAYGVATWLLLQVVDVLTPILQLPDWAPKLLFLILAIGAVPVLIFAWAFEITPEGIKREKDVNRDASITHVTAKKLDYVTIGLLVAAIAVVAVDRLLPPRPRDNPVIPADNSVIPADNSVIPADNSVIPAKAGIHENPAAPEPPPKSVAVLPFVNMSDDASNEYFSDGISEEILNALAKVTDLKVAGRTSSFAFKGKNRDLREIGAALNVSHILEGSVRKAGNRVRVTAQLIKVDDGYHVWSENYDRELDDIFAIQDEISAAILQQLKAHLAGVEVATAARADSRAYDLYLLASQRIYERNETSLQMAARLLNEAMAIDPEYAPTYAQLGIATLLLSDVAYGSLPRAESGEKALAYFQEALRLEPQNADALAGMGLYHINNTLDYAAAVATLEQAVAINPNLINARTWLSSAYDAQGNIRQSLKIQEETFALDPLHPATYNNLAQAYGVMGMPDKAMDLLADLERYIPNDAGRYATVGKVEVMMGRWADSDRDLSRAIEGEPLNYVDRLWLSGVLMGLGQYERLAEAGTDGYRAVALSRLGRTEEALILAAEQAGRGEDMLRYFQVLVENERYAELVSFLESRWPDLDAFETEWPEGDGYGSATMGYIAQAYSSVGNQAKFADSMARFRSNLDQAIGQGADNWVLSWSGAYYALLAGDPDGAIALLEKAVNQGAIFDDGLSGSWSLFNALRADPAFEAVKTRMLEHLNQERAALGLSPVNA